MLDTKHYSVLLSVYINEKPEFLKIALDSMLNQTVKPSEIVLIKDGPLTDKLNILIDYYYHEYPGIFNIIDSSKNIGLGAALRLGTFNCHYELVARMDSDDISLPTRCEKQLAEFNKDSNLDIVGTMSSDFIDKADNIISTRIVPIYQSDIYEFAKRRSPFNHISVMFKKSSVLKCGLQSHFERRLYSLSI